MQNKGKLWKRRKFWLIVGICSLAATLFAATGLAYQLNQWWNEAHLPTDPDKAILSEKQREKILTLEQQRVGPERTEETRYDFYTLIVGLDLRGDEFTLNTDSILVAHVMPKRQKVKLLSLPRDLRVTDLEDQTVKINSVFADGYMQARAKSRLEPELLSGKTVRLGQFNIYEELLSSGMVVLRETVEGYLDIPIDYTFLVHFQTVTELVDAVGGIEIDVQRTMIWEDNADGTGIYFEPGVQHVNGQQALNYARYRKDSRGERYDSSDFDRNRRQQEVIAKLVDKIVSWNSLPKVLDVIDIVAKHVKTDMGQTAMINLTKDFYGDWSSGSVETIAFPGYWKNPYVYIEDEDLIQVKEALKSFE